jgi:lysophospholipase L1-like esterase
MLALTGFLAFGDSMTAGEVVSEGFGLVHRLRVDLTVAYPTDLQRDLDIRYQTQQPYVSNAGVPGETTRGGLLRLPSALTGFPQSQVLLLLEGANDLNGDPASVTPAVLNMDAMVRTAKGRGQHVIVGTLPPQNPDACTGSAAFPGCISRSNNARAALVMPYNNGLKAMAASEGVSIVDVYQDFNGDVTTLIDTDGLHPTPAGYKVIATSFFKGIEQTLETAPTATTTRTHAPKAVFAPPRRR